MCTAWYRHVCPRDDIGLQSEMFNICWLDICDHLISSQSKLNNTIVCSSAAPGDPQLRRRRGSFSFHPYYQGF